MSGIPMRSTSAYKVCAALCKHELPVTLEQGIAVHGYTGAPKIWQMRTLYKSMVKAGYLIQDDDKYSLPKTVKKYFDGCEIHEKELDLEVIPHRYHKTFTEMKPVKRDPRLRDWHPVTMCGG